MAKRKTTQQFIDEAKQVHGDKYRYNHAEYRGNKIKVTIVCPEHGPFEQQPKNHLNGNGCPECGFLEATKKKLLSTNEFVERAREVHGDKYDYSQVDYQTNQKEVEIICPEHGSFPQKPKVHLKGNGCPYCAGTKKLTTKEFEERARKVHGNKYNYDHVDYQTSFVKVEIVCPEHGSFWQTPNNHLNGYGCFACGGTKKLTTEGFKQRAREVHGDWYDYNHVKYKNIDAKVQIVCPKHGLFEQIAYHHLSGQGCSECAKEKVGFWNPRYTKKFHSDKLENLCTFYIIEMFNDNEQFIKVGITTRSIKDRYKTKSELKEYKYQIIYEYQGTLLECSELEEKLIQQFSAYKYFPKYRFNGSSECLTTEALDNILKILN